MALIRDAMQSLPPHASAQDARGSASTHPKGPALDAATLANATHTSNAGKMIAVAEAAGLISTRAFAQGSSSALVGLDASSQHCRLHRDESKAGVLSTVVGVREVS